MMFNIFGSVILITIYKPNAIPKALLHNPEHISRAVYNYLQGYIKNNPAPEGCSTKIALIKEHRQLTNSGLKEAKDAVEEMFGMSLQYLKFTYLQKWWYLKTSTNTKNPQRSF